jgi:HEPN domain-containing protein
MTKNEHIKYWIGLAEDDLESAIINFEHCKYNWSLFISHLVIEKTLKALYVQYTDNNLPPKTHDLIKLAKLSNLELENTIIEFFYTLNQFNLEARYPDYKNKISKITNKEFTSSILEEVFKVFKWLKSLIKLEV